MKGCCAEGGLLRRKGVKEDREMDQARLDEAADETIMPGFDGSILRLCKATSGDYLTTTTL
jgi:hypothetical protein